MFFQFMGFVEQRCKTRTPIFMERLGSDLATVGLNELKYGYLKHFA